MRLTSLEAYSRDAEVDGLTFELLGFPGGTEIIDEPVVHFGVTHVEGFRGCVEASLGPVHPEAKAEAAVMRRVCDEGEAVWKFARVGIPIAYATKPACIELKHFETKRL
jgi:hypothetical protein